MRHLLNFGKMQCTRKDSIVLSFSANLEQDHNTRPSTLIPAFRAGSQLNAQGHFFPTSRQRFGDLWHFLHRPLFSWHFLGRFLQPVFHNAPFTDKMWVGRSNPKIWAPSSSTNVQSRAELKEAAWPNPDLVDKRSVALTSRREIWSVISSLLWETMYYSLTRKKISSTT